MIELGQVRRLIIAPRDRLVRFGYEYFEAYRKVLKDAALQKE